MSSSSWGLRGPHVGRAAHCVTSGTELSRGARYVRASHESCSMSAAASNDRVPEHSPPGWHLHPDYPSVERYWDGQRWTEHRFIALNSSAGTTAPLRTDGALPDAPPLAGRTWPEPPAHAGLTGEQDQTPAGVPAAGGPARYEIASQNANQIYQAGRDQYNYQQHYALR